MIAADGEMVGVMTLADALRLALSQGLVLVEVNPKSDPPVCKLLDFDTYKHAAKLSVTEAKDKDDGDESED